MRGFEERRWEGRDKWEGRRGEGRRGERMRWEMRGVG